MIDFVLVFRLQAGEEPRVRFSDHWRVGVRTLRSRNEPLTAAYETLTGQLSNDGYSSAHYSDNWREVLESGEPFIWYFERNYEPEPASNSRLNGSV